MSSTCPAAPCLYSNRIQSPLAVQKSPLYQCEVKSAYLAYSVCSEPTPFITTQWPKLFWRRKSGPAGMFPILFLCRLLCREKRSKVKQKPERAKLLHDWHKTVTKDKEDSMEASDYFEEWNGWDKKWNLLGGKRWTMWLQYYRLWEAHIHFSWIFFNLGTVPIDLLN